MNYFQENYSSNFLYLGYIANRIQIFLQPYISGKKINLQEEDISVIEEGKKFLGSILLGCKSIVSINNFLIDEKFLIGPGSSLNLALRILITMSNHPKNPQELENIFKEYREILTYLQGGKELPQTLAKRGLETISFFNELEQKTDSMLVKQVFL